MTDFVSIRGQYFASQKEWVVHATRALTSHPEYFDAEHADRTGWRGHHFKALCFDQKGRRCRSGGDFQRAEDDGAYPIWWIWPDQIAPALLAAEGMLSALEHLQSGYDCADVAEPALAAYREATR
ncbi:hypothetical protein [Tropicimonas sp. IMCC34011]|uniref:hypothetical protein n=1 Tax=Tropicimonas sp. IMCC34011 TaxID=2248759 RepID=UPI0018E52B12|nr:hypothetical protein [Tropicimonas sp. IMCC34011]